MGKLNLNLNEASDVLKYVKDNGIKILNLCHIPEDNRLKTLSFAVSDEKQVQSILEFGERVDGSSLFSYIDPDKSDIYITPRLQTAFLNPFSLIPTLNILCEYLNENGKPLEIAPESILQKAEQKLQSSTDVTLKALAELEFYIISKRHPEPLFECIPETHYHESAPFSSFASIADEILVTLENIGIQIKYGHAEVGRIHSKGGGIMEQHEIELLPQSLTEMANAVAVAKWVIRNICAKHALSVSFTPKIALEHAGTGMHIHICVLKNGESVIAKSDGGLSSKSMQIMGGILKFAPSLTAFGNTIPVSYLRLVSRKESPMYVCWGARNRLALIRIPLWWDFKKNDKEMDSCKRTFEYRAPDPSANPHLLFAGIAIAAQYGLTNAKQSLQIAKELHLERVAKRKSALKPLPQSCSESAACLRKDREYYEAEGVFPRTVIDGTIRKLESYNDNGLVQKLRKQPGKSKELMQKYLHCG